jgi:hypothetical protein
MDAGSGDNILDRGFETTPGTTATAQFAIKLAGCLSLTAADFPL